MLLIAIIFLWLLTDIDSGKIKINDPSDITGTKHIDIYLVSYPVALGGSTRIIDSFDENLKSVLLGMMKPGIAAIPFSGVRGIPPSNWVKFKGSHGEDLAIFTYKSVHRCVQKELEGSLLVDSLNVNKLKKYFDSQPAFYMARSAIAHRVNIHTVTTEVAELYVIDKVYNVMTSQNGAHSDIRVIPFSQDKSCYFDRSPLLKRAMYVLTGAAQKNDWTEQVFLSLMDENLDVIKSWLLVDPDTSTTSRSQKNWLPFWDKCKLMLSKRFGPEHVVAEFTHLRSSEEVVIVPSTVTTLSLAEVPSEYMIRGSAPVIVHPLLQPGLAIGCVHIRGKLKVYRHALYIMETSYPYHILSFSPLFAFKPYRNIEFVMSLSITETSDLLLTHGSSDCEPRVAFFNWTLLSDVFAEYVKRESS